jgi:histidine ammonia-lyase
LASSQPLSTERQVLVSRGGLTGKTILPNANFEPLPWVLSFQETGTALAQNSLAAAQRIVKLNDPRFTHLRRFLGTDHTLYAFGAMEFGAVNAGPCLEIPSIARVLDS